MLEKRESENITKRRKIYPARDFPMKIISLYSIIQEEID
jgi:hypothetical protein